MMPADSDHIVARECSAHSRPPSEADIATAYERWTWKGLATCIACGDPLEVHRYLFRHQSQFLARENDHQWEIYDVLYEEPVLVLATISYEGAIHVACARTALPHATWMQEAANDIVKKAEMIVPPQGKRQ